jgi:hypothetical protein
MLKATLKIILTNWIHLVGFYAMTYVSLIFFKAIGIDSENDTWETILVLSPLTIPILFLVYGPLIIGGFYGVIISLDIMCFNFIKVKTWKVLMLEWILIIPFFINWAFENKYWLWLTLCLSFLITQFIRKKQIERLLRKADTVRFES